MMFSKNQDDVCMIMKFLSNSPVTHVAANTHPAVPVPAVTSISCNHNYAINRWNNGYTPQSNAASFSSEKADPAAPPNLPLAMDQLLVMNTGQQKRTLGDNFDQRLPVNHHSFVTTADNRFLFASGFWDKSFRIYLLDTVRLTVQFLIISFSPGRFTTMIFVLITGMQFVGDIFSLIEIVGFSMSALLFLVFAGQVKLRWTAPALLRPIKVINMFLLVIALN
uniref:Uncharacterized protein n=1 Tax=Biomphalaria glabrata TaxID=6526 RepID=A0A2C9KA67_BIOGL